MKRHTFVKNTSAAGLLALITPYGVVQRFTQEVSDKAIEEEFLNPPVSAFAQCWYHWMNGNVSKEGMTLDLEAIKAGTNEVEIQVTNLWPNRLIGDEQLPPENKYTPGGGASGFASLSNGAIEQLPDWYKQGKPKPAGGRVTFTTWQHYNKTLLFYNLALLAR